MKKNDKKYVAGLDFGTASCRCLIVSAADGKEIAEAVCPYAHGVMEKELPTGEKLPAGFSLQCPEDYLQSMGQAVKEALKKGKIPPSEVVGIGLDFTSCTILPVDQLLHPLCQSEVFAHNPHAWVKLWKHHGAVEEAEEITALAQKRCDDFLADCGGRMNAEYGLPKILETLRRAPEVYQSAERFFEAGDWVVSQLTGAEVHALPFAGYKLQWSAGEPGEEGTGGYFSRGFLEELDPALSASAGERLSEKLCPMAETAGTLNAWGAQLTGLTEGISVAPALIDAHAGMPGCGAMEDGDLMMVLGTSACHMIHCSEKRKVPGIFGCVKDAYVPGLTTYEAGQTAVGDLLDWFVRNNTPAEVQREAEERKTNVHQLLSEKAGSLKPGETGLVGLDWLAGNRTPLNDASLTGVMTGITCATLPEHQYRAWIEALAFGTRRILENYETHGVPVKRVFVSGGIAGKNPLLMQIFADVTGKRLEKVRSSQAAALGSAICGAAAAGIWPDLKTAAQKMHSPVETVYEPDMAVKSVYDQLYQKYLALAALFSAQEGEK